MKVSIVRGGGLAGIVTRTEVESDALAADDERMLREHAARLGALELEAPAHEEAVPDSLSYEITIEDDGETQQMRLFDEQLSEPLRALIEWVASVPEREERIEAPGMRRRTAD